MPLSHYHSNAIVGQVTRLKFGALVQFVEFKLLVSNSFEFWIIGIQFSLIKSVELNIPEISMSKRRSHFQ